MWKFGSTQLMIVSLTLDSLNASHEQCGPLVVVNGVMGPL